MSGLEELLGARAGLTLAAFAVSWIAVVLLALVAANLHFRLVHLERSLPAGESRTPFGHLLGRSLADLLGPEVPPATRLVFVLATACPSCDRILGELERLDDGSPVALLWRDATPSPPPPLPPGVTILDQGPALSRLLGVGVSPFALVTDAAGRIVRATPVTSLESLPDIMRESGLETPLDRPATPLPHQPLKGVS